MRIRLQTSTLYMSTDSFGPTTTIPGHKAIWLSLAWPQVHPEGMKDRTPPLEANRGLIKVGSKGGPGAKWWAHQEHASHHSSGEQNETCKSTTASHVEWSHADNFSSMSCPPTWATSGDLLTPKCTRMCQAPPFAAPTSPKGSSCQRSPTVLQQ